MSSIQCRNCSLISILCLLHRPIMQRQKALRIPQIMLVQLSIKEKERAKEKVEIVFIFSFKNLFLVVSEILMY